MRRIAATPMRFDLTLAPPAQGRLDQVREQIRDELSRRKRRRLVRCFLLVGVGAIVLARAYVIGQQVGLNDLEAAGMAAAAGILFGMAALPAIDDAEGVMAVTIALGASDYLLFLFGGPTWLCIAILAALFPVVAIGTDLNFVIGSEADDSLHDAIAQLRPIKLEHCVATLDLCRQHAELADYQSQVAAQGRCLVDGERLAMQQSCDQEVARGAQRLSELNEAQAFAWQQEAFDLLRRPLGQPHGIERIEA